MRPLTSFLSAVFVLTTVHTRAQAPLPPNAWADKAIASQLQDLSDYTTYLRYHIHSVDPKGDLLRDLIESRDGPVARLIQKENRPLTPDEDNAERSRLQLMLDDPAAFTRHIRSERSARKQAAEIIKLIPNAMLFTYSPQQPPNAIALDFHPNPAWSPPSMASEVLTGIEGHATIDPATGHLTHLDATVFRPVNVGFGIFAHLYPGGSVLLDFTPAAPNRWLVTHFIQHLTLRALMLKTYKQNAEIRVVDPSPIDPMPYQQAIRLLLATPSPTH